EEWHSLCQVMGLQKMAEDPRFTTLEARKLNEGELGDMVARWSQTQEADVAMGLLQQAGVPAGVVQDSRDVSNDPQLTHRGYWVELEHPEMGRHRYPAPAFTLSRTPAQLHPSPCLGEHNEFVCRELLGLSEEEYIQLLVEGVLE
ncbi:MAG: CoA transferase, partial [Dehalococcoidia bacterium]|nr:CoA transferase [Dehalococcoidia bacterium]